MPPGDYGTITVHEDVIALLEQYRTSEESLGKAIERLLDGEGVREQDEVAQRLADLERKVDEIPGRTRDEIQRDLY